MPTGSYGTVYWLHYYMHIWAYLNSINGRKIPPGVEITHREWHIVDTPYRETTVPRVDSSCEDLVEIHGPCFLSPCAVFPFSTLMSHNTLLVKVRLMGNQWKNVSIFICSHSFHYSICREEQGEIKTDRCKRYMFLFSNHQAQRILPTLRYWLQNYLILTLIMLSRRKGQIMCTLQ